MGDIRMGKQRPLLDTLERTTVIPATAIEPAGARVIELPRRTSILHDVSRARRFQDTLTLARELSDVCRILIDKLDDHAELSSRLDVASARLETELRSQAIPEPTMEAGATAEITAIRRDCTRKSDMPRVSVFLLRLFEVAIDGMLIDKWISQKAKTVLKVLLLACGRAVPKDELIELIWPDIDPKAGKNNLNVAICHLRRTLAQGGMTRPVVTVQNNTCQLERGLEIWTDAAAFEEHARCAHAHVRAKQPLLAVAEFSECIALYQNELLAEDRYESWLAPYRQTLRDQYVEALDYLARRHLEAGDHLACSTICQKLLGVDICNEAAHRTLMRCYATLGQPNLMQRQYRSCVSALCSELGVAPGSETTALYRSLARA